MPRLYYPPLVIPLNTGEGYAVNPVSGDSIRLVINSTGDTIITGVLIPVQGKLVDPDLIEPPHVYPAEISEVEEIAPMELESIKTEHSNNVIYKVVFKEEHIAQPKQRDAQFNLQEYYNHPDRYVPNFEQFLPNLSILMNCIYWDERYPRLVTKQWLKSQNRNDIRLQIIGDISVDINGAIEFTEKVTTPASPCFIYNYQKDVINDGFDGEGIVVMAIDNLPCELPQESSLAFSTALIDLVPIIVNTDFSQPLDELNLPIELQHALILHRGKLTPEYLYIDKYL